MFLPPFRLLRKAWPAFTLLFILVVFAWHLTNEVEKEELESARPLPSAREDGAQSFPSNHRHLFHISDALATLPEKFQVIDLRSHKKAQHNKSRHNFTCTVSKSVPSFKICVYEPETDKFISGSILSSGLWEPYITRAFQNALSSFPHATVIDVGANIGYYSLLASAMGHKVIALEPQEENLKRFIAGAFSDHYSDNIVLLANALSDTHKNVSLTHSPDNQGGIRVVEDCEESPWGFGNRDTKEEECTVPTLTLDDLLYIVTTRAAIIKIDIEGYECRALATASHFFSAIKVPYVFMEWRQMRERQYVVNAACKPEQIRALSSFFSDRGYIPHEIRSGIRLNPYSAGNWRVGDIYWRRKELDLLVPSL